MRILFVLVFALGLPHSYGGAVETAFFESWKHVAIVYCNQTEGLITRVVRLKGGYLDRRSAREEFGTLLLSDIKKELPTRHSICLAFMVQKEGIDGGVRMSARGVAWFMNGVAIVDGLGEVRLDRLLDVAPEAVDAASGLGSVPGK